MKISKRTKLIIVVAAVIFVLVIVFAVVSALRKRREKERKKYESDIAAAQQQASAAQQQASAAQQQYQQASQANVNSPVAKFAYAKKTNPKTAIRETKEVNDGYINNRLYYATPGQKLGLVQASEKGSDQINWYRISLDKNAMNKQYKNSDMGSQLSASARGYGYVRADVVDLNMQ
jgi:hypothetical protein